MGSINSRTHVIAAGKEAVEQLTRRGGLIVVKVHSADRVKELAERLAVGCQTASVSKRVKSARSYVVVSENMGLSNRMCLSGTI